MPQRTLRQRKSFWFGVLVIEFLLFAWRDSMKNHIVTDIRIGDRTLLFERHSGVTRLVPGWPVREPGIHFSRRQAGHPSDVPAICAERNLPYTAFHDLLLITTIITLGFPILVASTYRPTPPTNPDLTDTDTNTPASNQREEK